MKHEFELKMLECIAIDDNYIPTLILSEYYPNVIKPATAALYHLETMNNRIL